MAQHRHIRRVQLTRDSLIIAIGILGLVHETLFVKEPRDTLVWLFGGFILGVPFLRMGDKDDSGPKPPKLQSGQGEGPDR
jgi:hypothetical protein